MTERERVTEEQTPRTPLAARLPGRRKLFGPALAILLLLAVCVAVFLPRDRADHRAVSPDISSGSQTRIALDELSRGTAHPMKDVRVSLGRGYSVLTPRGRLGIASIGISGAWRTSGNHRVRTTRFGREEIVVGRLQVEDSLVVARRQRLHEWRWRLTASPRPRLRSDGAVRVGRLTILPVAVSDGKGADVTPRGLRWQLKRA